MFFRAFIDSLSNREIASIPLLVLFLGGALLISNEVRVATKQLFRSFFVKKIQIALYLMVLWVVVVVFLLYKVGLWDMEQVKNTVFWSLSTAGEMISWRGSKKRLVSIIKENFTLSAFIIFITSSYTFGLVSEFILISILTFCVMMKTVANKPEYKSVEKLFDFLLVLIVLIMLIPVIKNIGSLFSFRALIDFGMPIWLSVFFIPILFVMTLYAKYEQIFIVLDRLIQNIEYRKYAKRKAFKIFGWNWSLLDRWVHSLHFLKPESKKDIDNSFQELIDVINLEKKPIPLPISIGWNPYLAIKFLEKYELAGSYHLCFENEWAFSSNLLNIPGTDISETQGINHIHYLVMGTKFVASKIDLLLYFGAGQGDIESQGIALNTFLEISRNLYGKLFNTPMPKQIEDAILNRRYFEYLEKEKYVKISCTKNINSFLESFQLILEIGVERF